MRQPSQPERAKESAFVWTITADTGMTTLLIVMAVTTGSLTMLSEAVRAIMLLTLEFYSLWILFSIHRDRLTNFEYGVGKLEQFVWVLVGLGLVVGALWVGKNVIESLFENEAAASPLGLSLAAIVNAINLMLNYTAWHAMRSAARDDASGVFGAQLSARFGMLVATAILQVTLTIAALAKDPAIAAGLDAAGASIVVLLKLKRGIAMISHGLPDLLDAPAKMEISTVLRRTIASVIPDEKIDAIRTRRSGSKVHAELTLQANAFPTSSAMHARILEIQDALQNAGVDADLSVVLLDGRTG